MLFTTGMPGGRLKNYPGPWSVSHDHLSLPSAALAPLPAVQLPTRAKAACTKASGQLWKTELWKTELGPGTASGTGLYSQNIKKKSLLYSVT